MIFSLPGGWFDTSWKPSRTYTSSPHPQEITRAPSYKGVFFHRNCCVLYIFISEMNFFIWVKTCKFRWKSGNFLWSFWRVMKMSWKCLWKFPDVSNFAVNFEPPKLRIEWRSFSTWVANIPGNEGAGPRRLWLKVGGGSDCLGFWFPSEVYQNDGWSDDPSLASQTRKHQTLLSVPSCYHSSGPE